MDSNGYATQVHSDLIDSIGARLREERERLGLSMQQVADAIASRQVVGGTRQSQRKYESGERHPDAPYLAVLQQLGFDVHYMLGGQRPVGGMQSLGAGPLATGDGLPHSAAVHLADVVAPWRVASVNPSTPQAGGLANSALRDTPNGALLPTSDAAAARPLMLSLPLGERGGQQMQVTYQVIPRHTRPAAAGMLASAHDQQPPDQIDLAGEMAYTERWLRQHLGHTSGQLTSIKVRGDSMAPTLLDGDEIIIDQAVNLVDVDGIYVLDVYARRLVKRVQMLYDGSMVLISDNTAYERQTIPRADARNVQVVGRMVWPRLR